MSFNLVDLRSAAQTRLFSEIQKAFGARKSASDIINENNQRVLTESKLYTSEQYHIFLSHSSKDAEIILGVLKKLNDMGYRVYVDWVNDPLLDRGNVTKSTAEILKSRMNESRCLLYATTEHSSQSKWMPWELGFMDGKKDRASILPIFENERLSSHHYKGLEYLGIYPYCIEATQETTNVNKL
jgi:hypothetical protein